MMLRALSAVPFPRSDFARSLLVTLTLLALSAAGFQFQQYRHVQNERLARWEAERKLDERLNRIVDLRFPEPPTLADWLAEWSRQAEVPIDFAPSVQSDVADELVRLYLPFYLDRFLGVQARLDELIEVQRTLHALRTGELEPSPRKEDDEKPELPSRLNPMPPVEPPEKDPFGE